MPQVCAYLVNGWCMWRCPFVASTRDGHGNFLFLLMFGVILSGGVSSGRAVDCWPVMLNGQQVCIYICVYAEYSDANQAESQPSST